jgi:hypothetical protein
MDCVKHDMKIKGVSMGWRVIEENGKRKHDVPTLLSGQGDDDDDDRENGKFVVHQGLHMNNCIKVS